MLIYFRRESWARCAGADDAVELLLVDSDAPDLRESRVENDVVRFAESPL